jgi:hypothetical protein
MTLNMGSVVSQLSLHFVLFVLLCFLCTALVFRHFEAGDGHFCVVREADAVNAVS